jgi:hypothetical protein
LSYTVIPVPVLHYTFSRFLIEAHWFERCKKYLGVSNGGGGGGEGGGGGGELGDEEALDESANPGPIDNGPLFKREDPSEIKGR